MRCQHRLSIILLSLSPQLLGNNFQLVTTDPKTIEIASDRTQSTTEENRQPARFLGLIDSDRWFLIAIACCVLTYVLLTISISREETIEVKNLGYAKAQFVLDINSATWVEWMQLEGVGEMTARKIVDFREQSGPFESVEAVIDVPGIGPKTLEKMRPHLTCQTCLEAS